MSHPKQISILLCLTLFFLCGCSTDDALVEESKGTTETTADSVNVVFRLQSNQTSIVTRATTESGDGEDPGLPAEYKVNNARVYFFDSNTKLFSKSVPLEDLTPDPAIGWVYEASPISAPQGIFDIFVVANSSRVINKETEDEFLADIDSQTYTDGELIDVNKGLVMANRAVANLNTEIKPENKADKVKTIQVVLERVVARLDVGVKKSSFELTDDGGHIYAIIKISDFYVVNYPRSYYTYRHIASLNTLKEPVWTMPTNFGDISYDQQHNTYVIDPYFFNKKADASGFSNQDDYYANFYGKVSDPNGVKWKALTAPANPSEDVKYVTSYCLENCMLAPAQKNGYSTGVLFKATMEPYNNVYRLNSAGNLELVTDKTQYADVLHYYDYRFFNSAAALEAYVKQTMPGATTVEYEAQKFAKTDSGYHCYYISWVKHLDNFNDYLMGTMEFAVVRNNLYSMTVVSVGDLGFGGEGKIVPDVDIPDEGESKLKVILNVKKWIQRNIDVKL